MSTDVCKFCGEEKPLIKAHIIPRSFCNQLKGESKHLLETRQDDRIDAKNWQNGAWDNSILCAGCDGSFSPWDEYGFQLFKDPPGRNEYPKTKQEEEAFILKDIDYAAAKLFVLSLLWRASVSKMPFFSKIDLGEKHEQQIANALRQKNPGNDDFYPFAIARLVEQKFPNVIYAPCRQKTPERINYSLLFLPSIKIMVQVDQRPLPKVLEPIVVRNRSENIAVPMRLLRYESKALNDGAESLRRYISKREAKQA